ncbi:MAG: hypothetical protein QXY79_03100, partial [Candidatus Methanomethylicia archaeon]
MTVIGDIFKYVLYEWRDILLTKIFQKELIKPLMKYREMDIIKEVILALNPKKVLEWGTGYSTLYFPKYLPKHSLWISIEHDIKWFKKIKVLNQNPNVKIHLVLPNNSPWSDEYGDG